MLKKLNKLIYETMLKNGIYNFSKDSDQNILCTFKIDDLTVYAKLSNDELSFIVEDANGQIKNLNEKEFSFKYQEEYDKFKKELNSYQNNPDIANDENDEEVASKIKNFNDVVEKEKDPDKNLRYDYTINGRKFDFRMLKDFIVDNYCECIFYIDSTDTLYDHPVIAKALLFIKRKNSIVVKIVLQDTDGQVLEKMTIIDFKKSYEDYYNDFKEAIGKIEENLSKTTNRHL